MDAIAKNVYIEDRYLGVTLGVIVQPRGLIQIDAPPAPEDGRSWRASMMGMGGGVGSAAAPAATWPAFQARRSRRVSTSTSGPSDVADVTPVAESWRGFRLTMQSLINGLLIVAHFFHRHKLMTNRCAEP